MYLLGIVRNYGSQSERNEVIVLIRIAICDDESKTVKSNTQVAELCLSRLSIVGEIETYTQSYNLLYDITEDSFYYDLILLDIEMPGHTGMELAAKIKPFLPNVKIIFITSHIEYAIDAFELSIFRYVSHHRRIEIVIFGRW